MAKTIIIENLRDDAKDLGEIGGRRIYLGAAADRGIASPQVARPDVELSLDEYKALMANKAARAALEGWQETREILVIGG